MTSQDNEIIKLKLRVSMLERQLKQMIESYGYALQGMVLLGEQVRTLTQEDKPIGGQSWN